MANEILEYVAYLLIAFGGLILLGMIYFVLLETWRRFGCVMGRHAGVIKDGKFICRTCGHEDKAHDN